jgi:hypothetical protein
MKNYIEKHWDSFAAIVLAEGVSDNQRTEMRLAFFAGSVALFFLLTTRLEDTGNPDSVTPADIDLMNAISDEIKRHRENLDDLANQASN